MDDLTPSQTPDAEPTAPAGTAARAAAPEAPAAPVPPTSPPAPNGGAAANADEEWDDADSILSWKLLVAIALVLGVLGLGAMVVLNGRKADPAGQAKPGGDNGGVPDGSQAPPAVRDSFERPDSSSSMGKTSTGEDWEPIAGTWGIKGNQAAIGAINDKGPRNLAVVDIGGGDGSVQAKAAKITDGWGLVFRYRGPNAYWYIQWSDAAKTFNIFKMVDGKQTKPDGVDNSGLVKLDADPPTIKVEFVGPIVTVFVNGKPIRTFTDTWLQNQGTKVGLFGDGKKVSDARWSEFVALKGLTAPSVTAPPKPITPGTAKPKPTTTKAGAADGASTATSGSQPAGDGGQSTP